MQVTIIGTGNMARAIASRLLAGGDDVQLLAHTPEHGTALAEELRSQAGGGQVQVGNLGDAPTGEVVVLAVPYAAAGQLVQQYAGQLDGRVLVDITNPLNQTYDGLATPPDSSAAEELARLAPGARVVKAFNTVFAATLAAGQVAGQPLDVFLAGDDADAKASVARLVEAGGQRPIDAGRLERARQLEGLGLLHISVQPTLGTGFASAVKLIA